MAAGIDSLSEKQRECLRLVWQGYDSKEIARLIGLKPSTVDRYIELATKALGCNRRTQAARVFAQYEGRSERSGSEGFGHDSDRGHRQIEPAGDAIGRVNEDRQDFAGFQPFTRTEHPGLNDPERLPVLRSLAWSVLILLALLAVAVLLKPGAQSIQEIANIVQSPKHQ